MQLKKMPLAVTLTALATFGTAFAQMPAGAPPAGTPGQAAPGAPGAPRVQRPPAMLEFADNTGFTSLYDGTLKGWTFDKALWDIQDGAIHIAATCEKPTGTVYAITDTGEYGDFILKYEMKGTGSINGGMQFRSYIAADPNAPGLHFPAPAPRPAGAGAPGAPGAGAPPGAGAAAGAARPAGAPGAQAAGGPPAGGGAPGAGGFPGGGAPRPAACANPGTPPTRQSQAAWDMYGPQADFDRNNNFTGMNYEQRGRGIIMRPGYSFYADESGAKVVAPIATKEQLDSYFKKDEWNQFMIICLGHSTSIYMNGHLVTQMIDNDPRYFRPSGKIGIESEAFGDLWTRNVSIKKL